MSEKIRSDKKKFDKKEDETKLAFILPLFSCLGYDIHDTEQIKPEFNAGFKIQGKDAKVDYAILQDDCPLVLVEAKQPKEKYYERDLQENIEQLVGYFMSCVKNYKITPLAILSNGIEYRFFADTQQKNVMDTTPFHIINFERLNNDDDIEVLQMFAKGKIKLDEIRKFARQKICENQKLSMEKSQFLQIKAKIKSEIKNPSPEFIALFKKISGKQNLQKNVKQEFAKLIKQAFESVINDFVLEKSGQKGGENLKNEDKNGVNLNANSKAVSKQNPTQKSNSQRQYQITQDEQKGFEIIASMLGVENVFCEKRKFYLNVSFKNDLKPKIICRFYFNSAKKLIKIGVGKNAV